jgi:hypothetical protein
MNFLDKLAGMRPVQQTTREDVRSRLARQSYDTRNRIQRVEYDEDGNVELWFDVSLSVGDHVGVPIPWTGKDHNDVTDSFIEWLNSAQFRTINYVHNGAPRTLTFRTSYVAAFEVTGTGRRHA